VDGVFSGQPGHGGHGTHLVPERLLGAGAASAQPTFVNGRLRDANADLIPPTADVAAPFALNRLNPQLLNGNAAQLGRSFDPEGLVVDPRTGHFLIADEYGPALYEFSRSGRLIGMFEVPLELTPKPAGVVDYVAVRDGSASGSGRQDNRGYEGIAISPDGTRLFAVLQDPLLDEGPRSNASDSTDNDGRDGRNLRIVVFHNDWRSRTYRQSVAQFRLPARAAGRDSRANPCCGRFRERDRPPSRSQHRSLGHRRAEPVSVPRAGARQPRHRCRQPRRARRRPRAFSSARHCRQQACLQDRHRGASDVFGLPLPDDGNLAAAGIVPVQKNDSNVFIDLTTDALLPNGNQAEKWEGLTIGPRLLGGGHVIVAGNDNDYSVTQTGPASSSMSTSTSRATLRAACSTIRRVAR
jgi:hypothetical protein